MERIIVADGITLNPGDLDWGPLEQFGEVEIFDRTPSNLREERFKQASIIVVNKVIVDSDLMNQLPNLRCICVSATGVNNVDLKHAKGRGISVFNVVGYGSAAVAQHVFATILAFTNKIYEHNQSVQNGQWNVAPDFCYTLSPIIELQGKTLGIYGFGKIGKAVAQIALAFGMKVIANHKHPERDKTEGVQFVSLEELLEASDFVTLHAPLTDSNQQIVNAHLLGKMKSKAILINTGRGGLINEVDLKTALEEEWIAGAGLDVLSQEPPREGNNLMGVKNCIITPHNAWASRASRQRLLDATIENISAFLNGKRGNCA